ncbi:MAG: hypothetical protein IBX57_00405 [Gammaproteobacteria bacterium]|nr:hypothetical protein [Gammaproteobacteria bacterium]
MAIENTPIQLEIQAIFLDGPKPVNNVWSCRIITDTGIFKPVKFLSMDIDRTYDINFTDYINLELSISKGVFTHHLIPNKDHLIVEVKRTPIKETVDDDEVVDEIFVRRYKAILKDETDETMASKSKTSQDAEASDLSGPITVSMQLLDIAAEQVRFYELGGIYKHVVPGDVIKYCLTDVSSRLDLAVEDSVMGVDMVEPDNTTPNRQVVIPHGIRPQDLPAFIQHNWGGVYNSDVGCYLQDGLWYVWPLFNTQRFDLEVRTMLIYNLPEDKYPGVERSYRLNGTQAIVLSTGQSTQKDFSSHQRMNEGNGVRFTHASRVMDGFGEVIDNTFKVTRSLNNSEFSFPNGDGYSYAPISPKRITDNVFAEASRLAKRKGSFLNLVWENSRPEIVYPGMPVKLLYLKDDKVQEVLGVVYKAQHLIQDNKPGPIGGKQVTNSSLVLFIEKAE